MHDPYDYSSAPYLWPGWQVLQNLTPIQRMLYEDWSHRYIVCPAGRRARKTQIFTRKLFLKAIGPGVNGRRYFYGAPTQTQANEIFWDTLEKRSKPFQVKKSNLTTRKVFLPNDVVIRVVGLDAAERIEGQTWHGCHITEVNSCKSSMWQKHVEPTLLDTKGFAYLDGVPDAGRDWYYKLAVDACGGALAEINDNLKGAYGKSKAYPDWAYYMWYSDTVLNPADVEEKKKRLAPEIFRQEYQGSFEDARGFAYKQFGPWNIRECNHMPGRLVHVGMDFNVDPMTAVLCHDIVGREGTELHQFGEIFFRDSQTIAVAHQLKKMFNPALIRIYPDATGAKRTTNATTTDLKILKNPPFAFRVIMNATNPLQRDRILHVNSALKSATGIIRYFVDPHCVHTINDFNMVKRDKDGKLSENQGDPLLTHITDAAGYAICKLLPIKYGSIIEMH